MCQLAIKRIANQNHQIEKRNLNKRKKVQNAHLIKSCFGVRVVGQ
jgi:hypothetical protein